MRDIIGSANMTQGALTTFTTDRFGNPNAALNLKVDKSYTDTLINLKADNFYTDIQLNLKEI